MSKIELTLAPNYVPTWTLVDAVRELFQNALDQQKQDSENEASWHYDDTTGTLTIGNATSKLTAASLLLGQTTKADDNSTIGQFGEGYKLATLVLLREGKNVVFYNYVAREVWRPRFVKSRRFGTDILTFFIDKKAIWEKVPSADLVIAIEGISSDEYYDQIVPSNLHLRNDFEVIEETEYGDVIDLPGKVFVNGLYVCDYEPYTYGYNFKPEYISLDRDLAVEKFKSVYGPKAIPVTCQEELDKVPTGYTGVIVNGNYNALIRGSLNFTMPEPDSASPLNELYGWFDSIKSKLDSDEIEQFKAIMDSI